MAAVENKDEDIKLDEKDKRIKRLEKELKFAKNQMANALSLYDEARQEADLALKAKGEFISKLSHEFRTPMNALMGYSDLLIKREGDDTTRSYASGIKSATNRLLNLFNDLIEVSRIESGITVSNTEEYDISVLIGTLLDSFKNEIHEKGLIMKLSVDENIPVKLYGDFYHLRQIVCNLLDNAVKYTEKGYVSIDIGSKKGDMVSENGRKLLQLVFRVKDTGAGIKKKDKDKLFDVFSQFNNKNPYANQGVGIGLTVSKFYSNKMHGDITFESRYGEGSVFTCTVMQEIVDETPIGPDFAFDGNTRKKIFFTAPNASVLVVDDSLVNLNVAKGLLDDYNIDVDTADGGFAALKKVDKKKYDIIFMDHMMPDIDGIETMKRIREKGDWCEMVPVIALTANATDEARHLFKMEGMDDFLAKPIELGILRDILLKWIPRDKVVFCDISESYVATEEKTEPSDKTAFTKERMAEAGINLETGMSYFGGNMAAYKTTMKDILKDCTKKLALTEQYLEEMDIKKYAIEAHSIKSVSASIGATAFSAIARENEHRAKDGDVDYVKKNGPEFIKKYHEFLDAIAAIIEEEESYNKKSEEQNNEDSENGKRYSDREIKSIIKEAISALKDFETDLASKQLGKLLSQKDRVDMVEKLYRAQEKIDDFEYEEAVKIMEELL